VLDRFLSTAFAHGRHAQRIQKIAEMERSEAGAVKA
jgi:ribose 5-phosphate isomerase RpiB